MNNIFVGNLSFEATKEDIQKLFEPFGVVANAVIVERKKGKSRGYGFVEMPNEEERTKAIEDLHGKEFMGRELSVSVLVPKIKPVKHRKLKSGVRKWNNQIGPKPPVDNEGGSKPWVKSERSFTPADSSRQEKKPYRREDRESKPWVKREGAPRSTGSARREEKPYRRDDRESKSWTKKEGSFRPSGNPQNAGRPYRKDDRGSKPFHKEEPEGKPYLREGHRSKPWEQMKSASKPPYKKFDDPSKPRGKSEGAFKSSSKPVGGLKPFNKTGPSSKSWPKKG